MAVYTKITQNQLDRIISEYDIGRSASLKPIAEGVENSNYLLETEKAKFILTIYEKRVKQEDLPFFLGLMEHLSKHNVPCPLPVHDKQNKVLKEIDGKPLAMVSFLNGTWPKIIKNFHLAELGKNMALLHLASKDFYMKRRNSMSLAWWENVFLSIKDKAEMVKGINIDELEFNLNYLRERWPSGLPSGIIHADLFPDNALFTGEKLSGIIDFYFACNDFFAYDIAISMNAWCFEANGEFNVTKARTLLASYNEIRPIEEEELEKLPLLASGAAMRFLLSRLYDWLNPVKGALVEPKNPMEYYQKLRFHMRLKDYHEYGI